MKCFSVRGMTVMPGLALEDHRRLGPHVLLGGNSGGSRYVRVTLDRDYTPELAEPYVGRYGHELGVVHEAWLFEFGAGSKRYYRLRKPTRTDDGILLRLTCSLSKHYESLGHWVWLDGARPRRTSLLTALVIDGPASYEDTLLRCEDWCLLSVVGDDLPESEWRLIEVDPELGEVTVFPFVHYQPPMMNKAKRVIRSELIESTMMRL